MLIQDQLAIAGGTSRAFRSYDTLNELMTNSGYNWAQVAAVYDECKLNAVTAKLIYGHRCRRPFADHHEHCLGPLWHYLWHIPWGYESYKTAYSWL